MPPVASPSRPFAAATSSRSIPRVDPRLVLSLAAVYVIWGSTYYAIRVAVETLPPMLSGALRFVVAGVLLLGIAVARGARVTWRDAWDALPVGSLLFIGGNGLVAVAETRVGSGVAAVVCATMPLWAAVFASLSGERTTRREWLGLGLGFGGVVALVGGEWRGGDPLYLGLLVASPLAWAVGSVLARRRGGASGAAGSALQMITGGLALAVVALARGERFAAGAPATAWLAIAYLMVFGSLIGFSAYGWLLRNTRPALATSYAYVNPVFAVLVGAVLGGERLDAVTIGATALIVGAVALVVSGRRR